MANPENVFGNGAFRGAIAPFLQFIVPSQQLAIHKLAESRDSAGNALLDAPHPLTPGEMLKRRVLLDGWVVEWIAGGRVSVSTCCYPTAAGSVAVRVFGEGVPAESPSEMKRFQRRRADDAMRRKDPHSGLAVFIVREAVESAFPA